VAIATRRSIQVTIAMRRTSPTIALEPIDCNTPSVRRRISGHGGDDTRSSNERKTFNANRSPRRSVFRRCLVGQSENPQRLSEMGCIEHNAVEVHDARAGLTAEGGDDSSSPIDQCR
jgi:hypothetical protein